MKLTKQAFKGEASCISVWARRVFVGFGFCILILLALVLVAGVVSNYWVPACQNCHANIYRSVAAGSHKSQGCLSCHAGKTPQQEHAFRRSVLFSMMLRLYPVPASATVTDTNCKSCHNDQELSQLTNSQNLRIRHESCATGSTCVSCHATAGHTLETIWPSCYSMGQCLCCHQQQAVIGNIDCKKCHLGDPWALPSASGSSYALTHGRKGDKHVLGDPETCGACHASDFCVSCHGKGVPHDAWTVKTHGQYAGQAGSKCSTCHKDTSFCDDCHGVSR